MKRLLFGLLFLCLLARPSVAATTITLSYHVNSSSNSTNLFWISASSQYNWSLVAGDNFAVTLADPSNTSTGLTLSFPHNLTISTTDNVSDSNMILGYWNISYNLGFLANTQFSTFQQAIDNNAALVNSTIILGNTTMLGGTRDTAFVTFDVSGQHTGLLYDTQNGYLLSANTSFGNYQLAFSLVSINSNSNYYSSSANWEILPILPIAFYIIIRKRYRSR